MIEIHSCKRVLVGGLLGGLAAGLAGVLGLASHTASAEPAVPQPSPVTVTQTVTAAPTAAATAPAATGQSAATAAVPAAGSGAATATAGATPSATSAAVTAAAAPAPSTITPAASGSLTDFFSAKGVRMEPQSAATFSALNIVLPMPRGWSQVPDPNVPDAFAVIADRVGGNGLYTSNAQVKVYHLIGDFDPKEAISHGFIDSQQLPAWRGTDGSLADYYGMPSSLIEGTFRENSMTLNTSRRHIIATSGSDRYLVSLAVTTSVDQAVAAADATDAIVTGFKVKVPGASPSAPAAAAAPAPAAAAPAASAPAAPAPAAAAAPAQSAPAPGVLGGP